MWLIAAAFCGTQVNFLAPVKIAENFAFSPREQEVALEHQKTYLNAEGTEQFAYQLALNNYFTFTKIASFVLTTDKIVLRDEGEFTAGNTVWESSTQAGAIGLSGNFDERAQLQAANAFWKKNLGIGTAVDVNAKIDDQTKFVGGTANLASETFLGRLSLNANLSDRVNFTGGSANLASKTPLGSLSVNANLSDRATFTGGAANLTTETRIGSFGANARIDDQTRFVGGSAFLKTKIPFGTIGVNGNFDENTSFTGGSVNLATNTAIGLLGVSADVDREMHWTRSGGFWKTQAGFGLLRLDGNFERDGNFKSSVSVEFPF